MKVDGRGVDESDLLAVEVKHRRRLHVKVKDMGGIQVQMKGQRRLHVNVKVRGCLRVSVDGRGCLLVERRWVRRLAGLVGSGKAGMCREAGDNIDQSMTGKRHAGGEKP